MERKTYNALTLSDKMPFGKHRGEIVGTLIENESDYVRWIIDNTSCEFDTECVKYLEEIEREVGK